MNADGKFEKSINHEGHEEHEENPLERQIVQREALELLFPFVFFVSFVVTRF